MKKTFLGLTMFLLLCLVFGGIFYCWQTQKDVRALNKTLPDGVKVTKSIFGNEYGVFNGIDGYRFKVPTQWNGIETIEYAPERIEGKYIGTSINTEGKNGEATIFSIDHFKINSNISDLSTWVNDFFREFNLVGDFTKDNISGIEVIKTQENVHLGGMYVYFWRKGSSVYAATNGSEEFIRYIITNGRW